MNFNEFWFLRFTTTHDITLLKVIVITTVYFSGAKAITETGFQQTTINKSQQYRVTTILEHIATLQISPLLSVLQQQNGSKV